MAWVPAAISAAGALIGGGMANSAQAAANKANIQMNKENRDWEEQMSNTSYQRGTKDMLAAGLNPMLAYSQGGASTPSNTAATVQPKMGMAEGVTKASAAALQYPSLKLTNAQADTQIELAKQEALKTDAMKVDMLGTGNYYLRLADQTEKLKAERMTAQDQARLTAASANIEEIKQQILEQTKGAQVASAQSQAQLLEKQVSYQDIQTILARLQRPEAEATAKWFATVGAASPAVKAVMSIGQWLKLIFGK